MRTSKTPTPGAEPAPVGPGARRNHGLARITVWLLSARQRARHGGGPIRSLAPVLQLATWGWLMLLGAEIPSGVRIGARLCLRHGGRGLIVHPNTVIGDDVTLYHRCTIGVRGDALLAPRIGNGVYLGAHCVVIGDITVGDGARIGAGAVVVRDVAPGSTMVGVPARSV